MTSYLQQNKYHSRSFWNLKVLDPEDTRSTTQCVKCYKGELEALLEISSINGKGKMSIILSLTL